MKKDVNIQCFFYHKYQNIYLFWVYKLLVYFYFIFFFKIIIQKNDTHSMQSLSKHGKVWMKKNSKTVTIQFFFLTLNFSSISKRKRAKKIQRFCSNYIKIVVCAISNYFVNKNNCFKVSEFANKIEHYRIFCKFSFNNLYQLWQVSSYFYGVLKNCEICTAIKSTYMLY